MSKPGSTPFGEPMEKKFIGSSEKRKAGDDMGPRASRGAIDASGLREGENPINL